MPRKPTWPPRIHVHRPSGRARIRVDGKDYYLGAADSDEAKAEYARLVALLASAAQASPRPKGPPPPTVDALVAAWLAEESGRLTDKELGNYRRALAVLVRVAGAEPAAGLDCARLRDVRTAMTTASWLSSDEREYFARMKREPRWSARVANRQVGRIKTVWRWLEETKRLPKGSWGELRLLRGIDPTDRRVRRLPKVRPASWEDVEATCSKLRSRTVRAMLRLTWLTGMRPGECRRMRGREVDRSGPVWLYRPGKHKNDWRGQDRVVPIGPRAQAILGPLLSASGGGTVFKNQAGNRYTASGLAVMVGRAGERAGRPWFVTGSCRHGARLHVTREAGLDAARAVLGHANLGTTTHYAHGVDLETAKEVAQRLG